MAMLRAFLEAQVDEIRRAIGLGSDFSIVQQLLKESRGDVMPTDEVDVLSARSYSADEKLQYLLDFRAAAERVPALLDALAAPQTLAADALADALRMLAELLRVQDVFQTPHERRGAAPEIGGLFEALLARDDVLAGLIACVPHESADIAALAARCLFQMALGVRIASTPPEHPLHPAHNLCRRKLVFSGAVPPLVHVARHAAHEELREAAIRALAGIAVDDSDCRDFVLKTILERDPIHDRNAFNMQHSSFALDKHEMLRREMYDLATAAGIGTDELQQLYELWGNTPDAQISREDFAQGLRRVGVTDPLVIEQSFSAFDDDHSGTIDFREFVAGLTILNRGTKEERARLLFQSYDLDKSGFLEPDEVYAIFRSALLFSGHSPEAQQENLKNLVDNVFSKIDVNGDNKLSFDEFKLGLETNTIINDCFIKLPFN